MRPAFLCASADLLVDFKFHYPEPPIISWEIAHNRWEYGEAQVKLTVWKLRSHEIKEYGSFSVHTSLLEE